MSGFIPPDSELTRLAARGAASTWGKGAVDLAQKAGDHVGIDNIGRWLDAAEPADAKPLRTTQPETWRDLRSQAAAAAQECAELIGVWR